VAQFQHVVLADAGQRAAEHLRRRHLVEAAGEVALQRLVALAAVHGGTVGGDGDDHVLLAQVQALGGLDRRQDVADAGNADRAQRADRLVGQPLAFGQEGAPLGGVEQHVDRIGRGVGDADDEIAVHHVLDQRDVLVADALDVVGAVAVVEHGRALGRLDRDDLRPKGRLQVVARRQRAGGAGAADERRQPPAAAGGVLEHLGQRAPGADPVHDVVRELRELVEDVVVGVAGQLGAGVVDLLDVALRARRADDVRGVGDPARQPLEPLGAHALGQHGDAAAAEDARDGDAAAAVVAGGRPHRLVAGRVEQAGDQPHRQARVGRQHLVRADHREPLAQRHHDPRRHPGQRARQLDIAGHLGQVAAVGGVEPVDAAQVRGVRTIRVHRWSYTGRGGGRVAYFLEGGQPHPGLAQARHGAVADGAVDDGGGELEGGQGRSPRVGAGACADARSPCRNAANVCIRYYL